MANKKQFMDLDSLVIYHALSQQQIAKKQDKITDFSLSANGGEIVLKAGNETIGSISTSQFVVKGLLKTAELVTKEDSTIIEFTFDTVEGGDKVIDVDVTSLIDIYTEGKGVKVENNVISIDEDVVAMVGHSHNISDVNGLQIALDEKANEVHSHSMSDVEGLGTELTSLADLIDAKADGTHIHEISDVNDLQNALDAKMEEDDVQSIFREQIYKLFQIKEVEATDFTSTDMSNPSATYAVVGNGNTIVMDESKSVVASAFKLANVELSTEKEKSAVLSVKSPQTQIDDVTISGEWNKSVGGNTMVSVNNANEVSLNNVTVDRTGGYNVVEIGLDGKGSVNDVVIDGLEINEAISNNGINIFSYEDGANILIQNCHFTEVSNPIRLSNMTFAKDVNITIKDCTFDKWESGSANYAGMILLQDHTSKSHNAVEENKAFSTFTITIDNVTGPYGKINAEDSSMEDICGSGIVDKQLVYMYADYYNTENEGEPKKPGLVPFSEDMFPTIIIK